MGRNQFKNRIYKLEIGIFDFVYNSLFTKIENEKCGEEIFCGRTKKDRENAYLFHFLLSSIYKNRIILNHSAVESREKLTSTLSISTSSYYRYMSSMISFGFAFFEGNHLRLKATKKIISNINDRLDGGGFTEFKLNDADLVEFELPSKKFDDAKLVLRLLYIKTIEHNNKTIINNYIQNSRKKTGSLSKILENRKMFVLMDSKGEKFTKKMFTQKSCNFNELYKFIYSKCREIEPADLGQSFLADNLFYNRKDKTLKRKDFINGLGEQFGYNRDKNFSYHTNKVDKLSMQEERSRLEEIGVAINNGEEFFDVLSSKNFSLNAVVGESSNSSYKPLGRRVKTDKTIELRPSTDARKVNKLPLENLTDGGYFFMTLGEIIGAFSVNVLSPSQYFRLSTCDFNLDYRFGLKKMSDSLGLDKSQCSRLLKSLVNKNYISMHRRYVFLSTVNGKNMSFINSMKKEYSFLLGGETDSNSSGMKRVVFRAGCLLYEIESDKEPKIKIKFRETLLLRTIFSKSKTINNRYENLSKRI